MNGAVLAALSRPDGSTEGSERGRTSWWKGEASVAAVSLAAGLAMAGWVEAHHLIYGLPEAVTQMTVARRLWDTPNPGFSQLGTGSLSLPALLFSIPSLFGGLWQTGLAGSLISLGSSVVATVAVYRIAIRAGAGRQGGWVACSVMMATMSWLYGAVVPVPHAVTVAAICLATAGIMGWAERPSSYSPGLVMLFCGAPTAAAVMSGYEGSFFLVCAGAALVVKLVRREGWTWRGMAAFLLLPMAAWAWGSTYNAVIAGSPTAWFDGRYSQRHVNLALSGEGLLPSYHHLGVAVSESVRSALDVSGGGLVLVGMAGLAVWALGIGGGTGKLWPLLSDSWWSVSGAGCCGSTSRPPAPPVR